MPNLKRDKDGLTEMQRRYVEAYVHDAFLNGTRAAIIAGYSERTAYATGYELKSKPHVRRAIERRVEELFPNVSFRSNRWPIGDWWRSMKGYGSRERYGR